jgi:hypothetical protein
MMERFELEILGGATERRYRRLRPEIEQMPWASFDSSMYSEDVRLAARVAWTGAAFQEHRTGAACASALRAMIDARVPVDLIALATRFPLDELAHVELCARMASALGGGTEIIYEPYDSIPDPSRDQAPLLRASEIIVETFCVGEALSIPLLRGAAKAARHPLPRAILSRIVRDEAAHGAFGFTFLDWAGPSLDARDRAHLVEVAARTIVQVEASWEKIRARPRVEYSEAHALGWMQTDAYLDLAIASMKSRVNRPSAERGFDPAPRLERAARSRARDPRREE